MSEVEKPTAVLSPGFNEAEYDLHLKDIDPVDVTVRNLTLDIHQRPSVLGQIFGPKGSKNGISVRAKRILDDTAAEFPRGTLTAIIGASGSGKTSMLNAIAQRLRSKRLNTTGTISYNGSSKLSSVRSAYVMQSDVLLPTLTVRETLRYAADLRLPESTLFERRQIVEEVILELGLKECADTRIGDSSHRGCSGGEKRRTSLGVQLLANPSVLFLDEVTSGLDASSAFQLVLTLKNLAERGRTVILSIHQPRSEIWSLIDNLILLCEGSILYSGPQQECLIHFESIGYPTPAYVNPTEHLVDIAALDVRSPELEAASVARVRTLKDAWKTRSSQSLPKDKSKIWTGKRAGSDHYRVGKTSFFRQVKAQTSRTVKTTLRDPMGWFGGFVEAASMSVISGWIFYELGQDLSGVRSREGALYTACALQGYLVMLFEIYRLSSDIAVFDQERAEGVVDVLPFIISRRLARAVLEDIPMPMIFTAIFYFMCGFDTNALQFFTFYAVVLLGQYLSVTFAMLSVSVARDFASASLMANLNFTIQTMCSGFFVQSNQIPIYLRWVKYCSYVWYGDGALMNNEFIGYNSGSLGKLYACPEPGGVTNSACRQYTGVFIVSTFGFPVNDWIRRPILIMAGFTSLFFILSVLILTLNRADIKVSKLQRFETDRLINKKDLAARTAENVRPVGIHLRGCSLTVSKATIFGSSRQLPILHPVNAYFAPNTINVIMGVSGSGKTSLLNIIARRLKDAFGTKYRVGGKVLFGDSEPSADDVRSSVAYVSQDDDSLLSTLTVRETLNFSAKLRLPLSMSMEEKLQRADTVMRKLGLRECADTLVGDELIKGISGGEKRRVSIAVQVLTDPRIILLDEPTSGLDAFTASSIIEVLKGLAEEGRTVIVTLHQPRSDLYPHFGNLLLLARGGWPVYAGRASGMLPYFSRQGYECPTYTNPADFALDSIAIDLKSSKTERATREKVNELISSWRDVHSDFLPLTNQTSQPTDLTSLRRSRAPFFQSLRLLLHRNLVSFRRDRSAIGARLSQIIGFGVIVTLFFAPLKSDFAGVQSRVGFIQEFLALYFVGVLCNIAVYPQQPRVFYREHDDGAYRTEAFFLQYTILELPFEIVGCLVFAILGDLAAGLPRNVTVFFVCFFNVFCIVSCGESVGIIFNTLFRLSGFAVNICSVVLSMSLLMSGILSTHMPPFLRALNYLSPAKWVIANLAPYTLDGVQFTCTDSERLAGGNCPINNGTEALELYNLSTQKGLNLLALAICTVLYRLAAYLVLKAMRTHWNWTGIWKEMVESQIDEEKVSRIFGCKSRDENGEDIRASQISLHCERCSWGAA